MTDKSDYCGAEWARLASCRGRWGAALLGLDRRRVLEVAGRLSQTLRIRLRRVPVAGLAMTRVRDTVLNHAFNLGEIPLTSVHVRLSAPDGRSGEGGASLMCDDLELAEATAIIDGVLAHGLEGAAEAARLVQEGLDRLNVREAQRRSMLERTRVSFAHLDQQQEDEPGVS
jgi:phosphonate C-P lyase system protein PhnG